MNRIEKTLLSLVALGLSFSVHALTAENRYDTIIDRNIFRLSPPPAVTNTSPESEALAKNIELSGIQNMGGQKKAYLIVKQAKPGPKDSPQYVSLAEGERQDFLEVVSISEPEGEVKILNSGNPMVLSFKNNSPKAVPSAPVAPGSVPPPPVANLNPTPQATVANSATTPTYGTATITGGSQTPVPQAGQPTTEGGLRTIPTRTLRLNPVATQPATEKAVDPLTQRVLMEVQQVQGEKSGQRLPPIPPLPQ